MKYHITYRWILGMLVLLGGWGWAHATTLQKPTEPDSSHLIAVVLLDSLGGNLAHDIEVTLVLPGGEERSIVASYGFFSLQLPAEISASDTIIFQIAPQEFDALFYHLKLRAFSDTLTVQQARNLPWRVASSVYPNEIPPSSGVDESMANMNWKQNFKVLPMATFQSPKAMRQARKQEARLRRLSKTPLQTQ